MTVPTRLDINAENHVRIAAAARNLVSRTKTGMSKCETIFSKRLR
jgi:hypothetical protein